MIKQLFTFQDDNTYPYRNLAYEATLMEAVSDDTVILYLWQNRHTVVIGRHQNAWKECRVRELEEDGGYLVRRLSGGGAVYHDEQNLNFTFLVKDKDYDVQRQSRVILEAVKKLGLQAELSGRNDITIDGRKFSGNAYYRSGNQRYHHGTLLVDVNTEAMARFLKPSKAKLQSKGVDSVRSRVVNLKDLKPDLTIDRLREVMIEAAEAVYGVPAQILDASDVAPNRVAHWQEIFESNDWRLGKRIPFTFEVEHHYSWGALEVRLAIKDGLISEAEVFSDSMEDKVISRVNRLLPGVAFRPDAIREALVPVEDVGDIERVIYGDVADLILQAM